MTTLRAPMVRRWGLRIGLSGALLAGLAGCGSSELPAVQGQVIFDGKPLTVGAVTFHPDAAKGNTTPHIPHGEIDAQGNYKLLSGTQRGAPPGWYKVTVYGAKPFDPDRPNDPEEWLIPRKYGSSQTSGLAVQVVANAGPGAYDLTLHK